MSAALDGIRAKVGAENCGKSCSRDGCCVDLTDAPTDRVIVDADKAFPAHRREGKHCDFILFVDRGDGRLLAAPVELKSGQADASKAIEQLRGGAEFAACFAPPDADCQPVLFHGKRLRPAERTRLNQRKVAFRDLELTVKTAQCGRPRNLASVLSG